MNDEQLLRYSRHILLPQVDIDGQQTLLHSTALVIGLGGLGSPVALYLAASGVGHLILVDDDKVELSNLQRQIAHTNAALGNWKSQSAGASAKALNPDVKITTVEHRLSAEELTILLSDADIVLDCSDNLTTRLLVNQVCYQTKTALVSGAAIGMEGQLMVVAAAENSPCYRCLYDDTADLNLNCAESGVLAPLVGVIGSMQALEALKVLLGNACVGQLTIYDAWRSSWQTLTLPKRVGCPVCG